MSTAPLAFFCTTLEGLDLACRLADKLASQPAIFAFTPGKGFHRIEKASVHEGLQLRIFIPDGEPAATQDFDAFVEAQASTISIDIKIGGLLDDPLTLLLSQFDTGRAASAAATSALSWLKRQIKAESIQFGVTGTNQVTGGSSTYKSMGYSPGALALLHQGGVWKNDRTGRSTFQPAAA